MPEVKQTVLRFVVTGNPMEVMSRFQPQGRYALNRTEWRGKEPRTCAVVSIRSRANTDLPEFDVDVAYRPKGVITFVGGTKYDGWTALMLDRKRDGTLMDGHGLPLPAGHEPVYLPLEVYGDIEFNEIDFGRFVGEFDVESIKHVSEEDIWRQFKEAKGGSIGITSTFIAPRRQRPPVKIILTNGPSGTQTDGFGTRIVAISKYTPHLQTVLADQINDFVFGFMEGRYSIGNVIFADLVMLKLDDILVDCAPDVKDDPSRFNCLGKYISATFVDELAKLLVANFEVEVSIVDGPVAALLLRRVQPS